MSNQNNQFATPLDYQSDERMQSDYQEGEEVQFDYIDDPELTPDCDQEGQDSDNTNSAEGELELDRRIRRQSLEQRSRVNSLSSGKSGASTASGNPLFKTKALYKNFRFTSSSKSPQASSSSKRGRSSNLFIWRKCYKTVSQVEKGPGKSN